MEKFAIDLDKVLDDFEESEDRAVQLDQNAAIKDNTLMKNSLGHIPTVGFDNKLFYISHNVCESQLYNDHLEKLDLSEADFAAALKPSTLLPVPQHYNANTSCDDIQTRSFQTVSGNTSINVKNENISERWSTNLNGKSSQSDLCTTADISTKHFANGYHIQNDEVLCISLQNTSDKKDSSSSSDIQIKLLPSFSSETCLSKADSTKLVKTDGQILNESIGSTFQTLHERQDCDELSDSNKQNDDDDDNEKTNFEESEVLQHEERTTLRGGALEINTFEHMSEKRGPDGTEEVKCYQDCGSESLDYILKMDKMHSLNKDNFYEEMMKQNLYSNSVQEEFKSENENSDKCTELQSNCNLSHNTFSDSTQSNDKTETPVGFSSVEPNEDDETVDIDDYLHDVSHIAYEVSSANNDNAKEHCENETRDHHMSPMKFSEKDNSSDCLSTVPSNIIPENCSFQKMTETSLDGNCENKLENSLESLNDSDKISSQLEMTVENKNSSKRVDILANWENHDEIGTDFTVATMGVRPKVTDCNANDNFEEKIKLEKELNLFDKINDYEFSAKNERFSYGEQLYEEIVFPVKCNENDSIVCEEEAFTQQIIESPKIYDKNGNITDHTENENTALGLTNSSCFNEQENLAQPTRLPRPTTLNLPVRVSVRPQISSECENLTTMDSSENLNELDGEVNMINQSSDGLNQEEQANEEEQQIGKVKPFWFPDTYTSNCMHCDSKFTVLKRRHHCRACGKVLCSQCCNQKTRLPYMDNKEARVCQHCLAILVRVQEQERLFNNNMPPSPSSGGSSPSLTPSVQSGSNSPGLISNQQGSLGWWPPNPNNPQEYCSTISPLQQVQPYLNCPPPTVLVPIGVLKRGGKPKGEPKQVMFSDGIRPGGDLTDQSELPDQPPPYRRQGRVQRRMDKSPPGDSSPSANITDPGRKHKSSQLKSRGKRVVVCDSEGPLPSILLSPEVISEGKPDIEKLINWLADEKSKPVVFALTKNLHISAKIVTLDCCVGKDCWCFSSSGLNAVGQDEVMVAIERLPNENTVPRDIFRLFNTLYDNASKGTTVSDLGNSLFPEGILGSREHSGFLFVRHTFQCLDKLVCPSPPFLIALLIQKWEVPWAKVFPLRLMLRLGTEFRYYPCPLISVRYRKPVYCEIGHTIMNVLADFRNYQFTVQMIPGVVIHMEEKKTSVKLPRNTYEKVMKALSNSNDHVFALASNFSTEADSHLVCIQNEDGSYQTQAINIQNAPRRVTGSSFIVFSGALKASTGLSAKSSIVEDGLLVQIPSDNMSDLKNAIRDMKDFTIGCGLTSAQQPEEVILLQWTKDDKNFNLGVRSPIDNKSLEGVQSIRIHTGTDYAGDYHLIRWTEVFFLQMEEDGSKQQNEPADPSRLAEAVAQACCQALSPHLQWLAEAQLTKIGLRVTLDSDKVGYDIGAAGEALPSMYMNALDSALIPVITCASTGNQEGPIILELIFHVLLK